jgi:hypothetical protein
VKRIQMIAAAATVVLVALAAPGSALPQAATLDTTGQVDGSHVLAPVSASQENGDTSAAVSAGMGTGKAATAGAQNGEDGATATVGCVRAAGSSGELDASASAGICSFGGSTGLAGAGGGSLTSGDTAAGAFLGCIEASLAGATNGDAQIGSCAAAGADDGKPSGSGGFEDGDDAGAGGGGDAAGGDADGESSSAGGGSGGGGGDAGDPCTGFAQLAGFGSSGLPPAWALALGALTMFALGAFCARRRRPSLDADLR